MDNTGLLELQKLTLGDPAIKIAILDGLVDLDHPCFNTTDARLVPWSSNAVLPAESVGLARKHGTAICSLIFGKPGSIVEGVAPGCTGLIIPIYSENEEGVFFSASQAGLARAINIAVEHGANIINISGGQLSTYGDPEFLLKQAIDNCLKARVLIVAAVGNEGCRCLHVPAAVNQVLAVGSMDESGNPTEETNFGDNYRLNGIVARGKNLTAALVGGTTFKTSGATSYAAPIVSGIVGLLMSLQIKRGIKPDAYLIKSVLENTATLCTEGGEINCDRFLRGKLNLPAAIAALNNHANIQPSAGEIKNTSTSPTIYHKLEANARFTPAKDAQELLPSNNRKETEKETASIVDRTTTSTARQIIDYTTQRVDGLTGEKIVINSEVILETTFNLIRDGPELYPSEKKVSVSDHNISDTLTQNINLQTMERTTIKRDKEELELTEHTLNASGLNPSDCGCGGIKAANPTMVYALGNISYDFGSEAHRDSFVQSMGGANPHDPSALLQYLRVNPHDAEELVWTLNIDSTPIYALYPSGSHGHIVYDRLVKFLEQQQSGIIQRISVPGISKGTTSLLMGHHVANLFPRQRGMYSWTTDSLVSAASEKESAKAVTAGVGNFLNRIYYQMRNMGVTAQERALNYAATNAFQVSNVFASALKENLELDTIAAEKSSICRPGTDCYDITLSFFNPKERLTQARKEYRFTVDVTDVVPVTVGEVRAWSVY
jgi:cyanobactin maturation PatA/PatG family protease